ncbi:MULTISPECIES: thioredoxin domain-containing protein [unclassified Nocardia]|uniref:DsbA family protein n=1 Tax=unclassified Nocardia TaxID=2637762 RepID=UPI001CE46BC9|nr:MULTISPECIES: thioredoxin domain-containing protein [unclassified Nocardia]
MTAARQAGRGRGVLVQVLVAGVLVALVAGIGISLAVRRSHDNVAIPAITGQSQSGVVGSLTDTGAIRIGKPDAGVTVRIVSDAQCPYCKLFESASAATLTDAIRKGTAAVEYNIVSFLDPASSGTRYSTRAANAAYVVAAADPAKFPDWVAALFAQQPPEGGTGLTDEQLVQLSAAAGYTDPAVAQAITGGKYDAYVQKVSRDVAKSGITATPSVFVNGRQLTSQQDLYGPDGLRKAIDAAEES